MYKNPMTDTIKSASPAATLRPLLGGASSCAVVFNALSEVSRAFATDLWCILKPYGIPVSLAGLDKKKSGLPVLDILYTPVTSQDYTLLRQLKAQGKIGDFLAGEYDLLIDASLTDSWKVEKLLRKIRAHFRVGINKTSDSFDFCFSLSETLPPQAWAFADMLACLEKIDPRSL